MLLLMLFLLIKRFTYALKNDTKQKPNKSETPTGSHWITYFWHAKILNCKLHQRHCTFLSLTLFLSRTLDAIHKYFARNRKTEKAKLTLSALSERANKLNALAHGACLAFQRCQLQFVHNLNNFAVRGVCTVCVVIFNNTKTTLA